MSRRRARLLLRAGATHRARSDQRPCAKRQSRSARTMGRPAKEWAIPARAARHRASHETLRTGMRRLGFAEYLPAERQSNIITAFRYPDDPSFRFEDFYRRLRARGFLIYPGKLSQGDCFRIGTIGRINEDDMGDLVAVIGEVLDEIRR